MTARRDLYVEKIEQVVGKPYELLTEAQQAWWADTVEELLDPVMDELDDMRARLRVADEIADSECVRGNEAIDELARVHADLRAAESDLKVAVREAARIRQTARHLIQLLDNPSGDTVFRVAARYILLAALRPDLHEPPAGLEDAPDPSWIEFEHVSGRKPTSWRSWAYVKAIHSRSEGAEQ